MRFVSIALIVLLTVSVFGAPPQPGSLQGQVRTEPGSSPAFVTVMATSADGLFITTADKNGQFAFANLPPGKINLVVSKLIPGIQQTTRAEAFVTRGVTTSVDIQLPGPLMNQCNCACPYQTQQQYQQGGCSPCSFMSCPP